MKKILSTSIAAALCLSAAGQDLNPQVQVTNEYEARMTDVRKNSVAMAMPDSLTNFSTAIDYSVFPTDYKGAYDFVPYFIDVAPQPASFDGNRLYFKAGAGYSFHPTARLVYSPVQRGLVRGNAFMNFDGYGGSYNSLDVRPEFSGHDYAAGAGANLRWNKEKFDFFGTLGYKGIYTRDDSLSSVFHNFFLEGRLKSNPDDAAVQYEAGAKFFYSRDNFAAALPMDPATEFGCSLDGYLVPVSVGAFSLRADLGFEGSFSNLYQAKFSIVTAPKAVFDWNFMQLVAGARFAFGSKFGIYPDLHASTMFGGSLLKLYLDVDGGQKVLGYTAMKTANHWVNPHYISTVELPRELLNARLGLSGKMLKHLQYDLRGGYVIHRNALMDGLKAAATAGYVSPYVAYADYQEAGAELQLDWVSERFSADARAAYRWTDLEANALFLGVPAFEGDFSVLYNWNRRIWAGASLKARSKRESTLLEVPAFADLGLYAEYDFSRAFALWVQAGNLLGQRVVYSPTHIAGGVYLTAGISLKLK